MPLSPSQRRLRSQIAAETSWANTADRTARTAPARAAAMKRFEDEVDPERKLPPKERAIRAEHARRAHMAKLALKGSQARNARRSAS